MGAGPSVDGPSGLDGQRGKHGGKSSGHVNANRRRASLPVDMSEDDAALPGLPLSSECEFPLLPLASNSDVSALESFFLLLGIQWTHRGKQKLGSAAVSKPKEPQPEEPKPKEPQPEKPKPQEPKPQEPKPQEPKPEEPKPEEPKPKEPKPQELQPEEPQPEEPQSEEPQPKEAQPEESTVGEEMTATDSRYCGLGGGDYNGLSIMMGDTGGEGVSSVNLGSLDRGAISQATASTKDCSSYVKAKHMVRMSRLELCEPAGKPEADQLSKASWQTEQQPSLRLFERAPSQPNVAPRPVRAKVVASRAEPDLPNVGVSALQRPEGSSYSLSHANATRIERKGTQSTAEQPGSEALDEKAAEPRATLRTSNALADQKSNEEEEGLLPEVLTAGQLAPEASERSTGTCASYETAYLLKPMNGLTRDWRRYGAFFGLFQRSSADLGGPLSSVDISSFRTAASATTQPPAPKPSAVPTATPACCSLDKLPFFYMQPPSKHRTRQEPTQTKAAPTKAADRNTADVKKKPKQPPDALGDDISLQSPYSLDSISPASSTRSSFIVRDRLGGSAAPAKDPDARSANSGKRAARGINDGGYDFGSLYSNNTTDMCVIKRFGDGQGREGIMAELAPVLDGRKGRASASDESTFFECMPSRVSAKTPKKPLPSRLMPLALPFTGREDRTGALGTTTTVEEDGSTFGQDSVHVGSLPDIRNTVPAPGIMGQDTMESAFTDLFLDYTAARGEFPPVTAAAAPCAVQAVSLKGMKVTTTKGIPTEKAGVGKLPTGPANEERHGDLKTDKLRATSHRSSVRGEEMKGGDSDAILVKGPASSFRRCASQVGGISSDNNQTPTAKRRVRKQRKSGSARFSHRRFVRSQRQLKVDVSTVVVKQTVLSSLSDSQNVQVPQTMNTPSLRGDGGQPTQQPFTLVSCLKPTSCVDRRQGNNGMWYDPFSEGKSNSGTHKKKSKKRPHYKRSSERTLEKDVDKERGPATPFRRGRSFSSLSLASSDSCRSLKGNEDTASVSSRGSRKRVVGFLPIER